MKQVLTKHRVYLPLRSLCYGWNPPPWFVHERLETRFYRQFVRPNSLCFDVGANVCQKAAAFRAIGARVVCVEPIPTAVHVLRESFGNDPGVIVVHKALGREVGEAAIHVGDSSTISSMSDRWIKLARDTCRMEGRTWTETILVPVTTIDALISKFGLPDFCKIDVEGYEYNVILGLSRPLPALSLEFQPEMIDEACRVNDRLEDLGHYNYNYSFHSPLRFELGAWVGPDMIRGALEGIATGERVESWGDVFAVMVPGTSRS